MNPAPRDWRPLVAALANPDARHVMGLLLVGDDPSSVLAAMSPSRRRHLMGVLEATGAVEGDSDGRPTLRPAVFGELLRQAAEPRAEGVARFLRDGRIVRYPVGASDRAALLRHVVSRVLTSGEVVTERAITERLRAVADDPVALRRALVDEELVERRRDGSEYALVDDHEPTDM